MMKFSKELKIIISERIAMILTLVVIVVLAMIVLYYASISGANKAYNDYITNLTEVR